MRVPYLHDTQLPLLIFVPICPDDTQVEPSCERKDVELSRVLHLRDSKGRCLIICLQAAQVKAFPCRQVQQVSKTGITIIRAIRGFPILTGVSQASLLRCSSTSIPNRPGVRKNSSQGPTTSEKWLWVKTNGTILG